MSDYYVSVDNEESNEQGNTLSMTGRVNSIQCAASIRLTSLADKSAKEQKKVKQSALIEAFLARQEAKAPSQGEKVSI